MENVINERRKYIIENYMVNKNFGVIVETEIPLLATKFGATERVIKNDLKAVNCVIYQLKPKGKIKNLEDYKERVQTLKLKQERNLPKYVRGKSVRTLIPQSLWSKVRNNVLEENGHRCSICNFTTDNLKQLQVHEEWEINKENIVIKLAGLSLLCHMCHSSQHIENTYFRTAEKNKWPEVKQKLEIHFMKVNECTQETLIASQFLATRERLRILSPNVEDRLFQEQERLESVEWSYSLFEEMPLRDEVITALQKKVTVLVQV